MAISECRVGELGVVKGAWERVNVPDVYTPSRLVPAKATGCRIHKGGKGLQRQHLCRSAHLPPSLT